MVKKMELYNVKHVDALLKVRSRDITRVSLRRFFVCDFLRELWLFATNGKVLVGVPVGKKINLNCGEEYALLGKEPIYDLDDETVVFFKRTRAKKTELYNSIQRIVNNAQDIWFRYKWDYKCRRLSFEYLLRSLMSSRQARKIYGTDIDIDLPIVNPCELWFAPEVEYKVYDNMLLDYGTMFYNPDIVLIAAGCINSREDLLKILKRKARK